MAHNSLTHSHDSMKLEEIQDELGILLEEIEAMVLVSLDENFNENKQKFRYSYLSALHRIIKQAICFYTALIEFNNEAIEKKFKFEIRKEFNEKLN